MADSAIADDSARRRRRPRLSDEVSAYMRELIVSGRLRPCEFIRPENVAEELGVSATPAREGLLSLQSEGMLRVQPRRGFMVAPLSSTDISDVFTGQSSRRRRAHRPARPIGSRRPTSLRSRRSRPISRRPSIAATTTR